MLNSGILPRYQKPQILSVAESVKLELKISDAVRGASEACDQNVCCIHCGSKRAKQRRNAPKSLVIKEKPPNGGK